MVFCTVLQIQGSSMGKSQLCLSRFLCFLNVWCRGGTELPCKAALAASCPSWHLYWGAEALQQPSSQRHNDNFALISARSL